MKKIFCLDACALIAFLTNERGADTVEKLLIDAVNNQDVKIIMHKINLLEVYYGIERFEGKDKAEIILTDIRTLPIKFIEIIDDIIFFNASYIKSNYKLSLADSIVIATSNKYKAELISSDHHEFDVLELKSEVKIKWIR